MRIVLADDHALVRDAVRLYIEASEPGVEVTAAGSLDEVVTQLRAGRVFDLAILDWHMPGMDGVEGLHRLRALKPDLVVAILSGSAGAKDMRAALGAGAVGFFPKTLAGPALWGAVKLVLAGERFLPSSLLAEEARDAAAAAARSPRAGGEPGLSPRETEVLDYLARGLANKEIARALDLQEVTVKLHVRGICRKMGVKNRTQAALKALEHHHGAAA